MKVLLSLLSLGNCLNVAGGQNQYSFNFMQKYKIEDIANKPEVQDSFINDVMTWEGRFATDMIGINYASGLTYDGAWLHYENGLPFMLHDFSAASKESVHLGMLALAVSGNPKAKIFFTSAMPSIWGKDFNGYILDQLTKKITSYEKWNNNYPGFGGYLPWYHVSNDGMSLLDNWNSKVPSLDNGEMIWSIAAAVQALQDTNQTALATRYQAYFDLLADTAVHIFYNSTMKCMSAESAILNVTTKPWAQTYNTTSYYLDDPYEGELFTLFAELYGNWSEWTDADKRKDDIWITKRAKAIPVNYTVNAWTNITVQRGYTFSSHEQWKFMELPYFDVDIAQRLFLNGERARAYHSYKNGYPGLFAAVTNVTEPSNSQIVKYPDYVSSVGIASISFQPITTNNLFTPYGAYPMMLHPSTRGVGLAWYANMLSGPLMQGPQGSTESIWIDGTMISPVQTWDSKITSVLAMNGGILDLTRKYLKKTGNVMKLVILGLVVPLLANALNCLKGVLSDLNNEISLQPVSIVACSSSFCKSVYQNDGFTIVYTLGCDVSNTCNAVESIADIGKSQRIACCNTDSCVHPDASKPVEYPLDNIAFSTATAAYQVEGAWNTSRGPSMWDIYVQRPNVIKNNDTGNDACKSYDFWQKDVDLLKSLGVKAYRFSISWGRIFPNGVDPAGNDAGVAYYKGLIKALKAANITPMVTMYHWDLPINFMDRGGWLNTDTAIAFGNYAKYLFNTFGDDVQDWIPINEPNSVIDFEYCGETHADAPGDFIPHCAWTRYLAAYNLLRAHLEAFRAYKSLNGNIKGWRLGIALNGPYCYPASESQMDIEASERCYQFNYGLLGHVLFSENGDWAPAVKKRLDSLSKQEGRTMSRLPAFTQQEVEELRKSAHFLGVNYYLAATVKSNLADLPANRWNYLQQDYDSGSYTIPTNEWQMINASNGWIAYTPFGLRALLVKMNQEYPKVPIVITENGCMDTYDENLQDNTRIHYLRGHLMAIAQAKIADGVNIQGYTYWSLLDNFEWLDGYTTKFGLHRVDFNDPNRARTAKKSATFYTDTIKAKKLTGFAVDSRW